MPKAIHGFIFVLLYAACWAKIARAADCAALINEAVANNEATRWEDWQYTVTQQGKPFQLAETMHSHKFTGRFTLNKNTSQGKPFIEKVAFRLLEDIDLYPLVSIEGMQIEFTYAQLAESSVLLYRQYTHITSKIVLIRRSERYEQFFSEIKPAE